jgi:cytoskeletal protein CcmA (bactofilin family)
MPILQKRSLVAGVLPTTASLLAGELGINVPDGRVFLRKSGSGSDTIQSAITTGAQNSGSVILSGSLTLFTTSGSALSVASDTLEFNGDQMEFTGSLAVSGSMKLTGSLSVAGGISLSSGSLEVLGDQMEFTGSFVNSGSFRSIGTSTFTGSAQFSGSMVVSGSLTVAGNIFGSVATASLAFTASSADSFLVRSSLTSSLLFVTGSSRLGSLLTDAHTITGSFSVSGSINIDGGTY